MAMASNESFRIKTLANPVTKKMLVAMTGLVLLMFLLIHLLGNLSLFAGVEGINAYAKTLHSIPAVVWLFRLVMAIVLIIHVRLAIQVTLENRAARPIAYARRDYQKANLISRSMIWTGLSIAIFLGYHLLHYTVQSFYPVTSSAVLSDSLEDRTFIEWWCLVSKTRFPVLFICSA
ncbi:MAG: succinate dehydrogenase/fumarate reductase, cytochrome b558 subunit [Firmicutes bacterium]|nr:succinate dehydrogenase/fumarate reductase, cytochrome b558 subunit [Bacillota bacterium]